MPHIFGTLLHIFGTMPHIIGTVPHIFGTVTKNVVVCSYGIVRWSIGQLVGRSVGPGI